MTDMTTGGERPRQDLPARLAARPQWKGLPIPFFVTMRTDGTPDFKLVNEANRERCARERLCWVCGQTLDYWIVFVGGPLSWKNRLFLDGPLHPECAEASFTLCPFLLGRTDYGALSDMSRHDERIQLREQQDVAPPPDRMCIYKTRGYRRSGRPDSWLFLAAPAVSVTWRERVPAEGGTP